MNRRILKLSSGALIVVFVGLLSLKSAEAQVYQGYILDEISREPVPHSVIILQNPENEYVTHASADEKGFFLIKAPNVAEYYLYVNRIGYSENSGGPFKIGVNDTLNIQIHLLEIVQELGEITVETEAYKENFARLYLERNKFFLRKRRGLGRFFTREDLDNKHIYRTSDIFRGIGGVRVLNGQLVGNRGNCPLKVYINGLEVFNPPILTFNFGNPVTQPAFSIDNMVRVDNIIGVEVYTGSVGQPMQYGRPSRCGSAYFWIK